MTTAWSPEPGPGFRLALLVIRSAAGLVPEYRRDEWRQEWETEVWYHMLALRDRNDLGLRQQWRLLLRCAGSYRHALWVLGRELCRPGLGAALVGAARGLRVAPLRNAAAIAGAGLALGAGALAFGAAAQWRAQPLPFPGDDRTIRLYNSAPAADIDRTGFSRAEFEHLRSRSRSLEVLAAFRRSFMRVTSAGGSQDVAGVRVTPEWFRAVGIEVGEADAHAWFGRLDGDRPVAVVREDLWPSSTPAKERPRVVTIDGVARAVVGVLPAGFQYPDPDTKVWVPLRLDALSARVGDRAVALVGRLRSGVAAGAAEAELGRLSLELQAAHPEGFLAAYGVPWTVEVESNRAVPREQVPLVVLLFAAAVALVAGAGIGVGMLARGAGPGRERTLGAVVLMGGAAVIGGGVLALGQRWMSQAFGTGLSHQAATAGFEAMAFLVAGTLGAAGLTVVGRRAGASVGAVAASVTCAVLVIAGAATLGRAYEPRLRSVLPQPGLVALRGRGPLLDQALARRASALPGVRAAALTSSIPGLGQPRRATLEAETGPGPANPSPGVEIVTVTPGFFDVAGVALVSGRDLLPRDDADAEPRHEVVVNRELARRFWPEGGAVGRRLVVQLTATPTPWLTIVGVVDDGRRLPQDARPVAALYLPPGPGAEPLSALVLRSDLPPARVVEALYRNRVARPGTFGPPIAVDDVVRAAAAPYRVGRGLLGLVALAATLLAVIALAGASRRAAWRGLGVGLGIAMLTLWCGSGLAAGGISGLAVSPVALGLGLVAGFFGVIDPSALRRRWSWPSAS